MDLSRTPNEKKLYLCRWYFLAGFVCLPFVWAINTIWFFEYAFRKPQFEEQKSIRKYVIFSGIGSVLWIGGLLIWMIVFQQNRTNWGELGDDLSLIVPRGSLYTGKIIPVSIQPRNVFGLKHNISGNIHFTAKQEVIYPVAAVLSIQDFIKDEQKFLRFPEGCTLETIRMSPNRKLLAIAERMDSKSFINIYDLQTMKKRRTIYLPIDNPNTDVSNMSFTYDSKGIAILSKEPDAFLTLVLFDKSETVVSGRVSNRNQKGYARVLACNPNDPGLVAVGGDFTFKIMTRTEKGFTLIGNIKTENLIVTSCVFLSGDVILVGTSQTELILVENGEPKVKFPAETIESFDISNLVEGDETEHVIVDFDAPPKSDFVRLDVLNLTQFVKGFAFSVHNYVHIFEKISNFCYIKKTVIHIPMNLYPEKLYKIENLAVNLQQDTIIVTPQHSQIYIGMVFVPETLKVKHMEFKTLGEPLHIDGIIGLTVCPWKPIVMTASKDQTIRIWNYETGKVELVKKYEVEVTAIDLHPSGIFVAVGFSDQLRLMEIMLDDMKITKTFNFPKCTCIAFSHKGHMLAVSYEYFICVVSVFSFDILRKLTGHNGLILSLAWSTDDTFLESSGADGAVYEWDLAAGNRSNEIVHKGTEYRCIALTQDRLSIYTVSNKGTLKEISNSDVVREIKLPGLTPLTSIALARSDLVMFIATEKGHLYNVQVPFLDAGGGRCTNTRFFHSVVTKIRITYDDRFLVTATNEGTLVIWTILNNEGRIAKMDSELLKCTEVMISRWDLIEKNDLITSLELRIEQQKSEFLYAREQGDSFHSEQIRDIHKGYCDAIEDLKEKNETMEHGHTEELNKITSDIAQANEDHQKELLDLENEFHEKIIIEYEKSASIKKQMNDMRDDYELKLRKSAGCLQDTIEALENDFKKQLQERQDLIQQLMKEVETKKIEFSEYCQQVEADNDRRMVESQLNYEKLLKLEQETSLKWRGEAGVFKKKFATTSKDCIHLREEIDKLRIEHDKYQKKIYSYEKDMDDFRNEIEERDQTIREKEKRVHELLKKNQELEKYKQVLQHKINELKAEIEPREKEIKDKKDQLADMENELEGLQYSNQQLELQLSELKDKYHSAEVELRVERCRCKTARSQIMKICGDIHEVSGFIQKPDKLKIEVRKLYLRYADNAKLKINLSLDADVQNEFLRQRAKLEKLSNKKTKLGGKSQHSGDVEKLIGENVTLITELNRIRYDLTESQKYIGQMESLLGVSRKYMPSSMARTMLTKAVANYDEIDKAHETETTKLKDMLKTLTDENQKLRSDLTTMLITRE